MATDALSYETETVCAIGKALLTRAMVDAA
ncbi:hypothetical protein SAMN05216382_0033 [Sphingomonas palmae]|uniref:Uncharacterized protein n=1 Tax=Sphingomonas palmae TaxID=1855283 RepID=A0A1H7FM81_9SPHN|nr:hypothetical protein SAMN05216382_0033 [Sphingomonas palmae]